MKMLILGGTVFLGRHIAAAALARGHALTLFTRGQHGAELFPAAEHLRGNRDGDLAALKGRRWDAVIDTSGYIPRAVRDLATLLADCGHYTFISSVSAYADASEPIMRPPRWPRRPTPALRPSPAPPMARSRSAASRPRRRCSASGR